MADLHCQLGRLKGPGLDESLKEGMSRHSCLFPSGALLIESHQHNRQQGNLRWSQHLGITHQLQVQQLKL